MSNSKQAVSRLKGAEIEAIRNKVSEIIRETAKTINAGGGNKTLDKKLTISNSDMEHL